MRAGSQNVSHPSSLLYRDDSDKVDPLVRSSPRVHSDDDDDPEEEEYEEEPESDDDDADLSGEVADLPPEPRFRDLSFFFASRLAASALATRDSRPRAPAWPSDWARARPLLPAPCSPSCRCSSSAAMELPLPLLCNGAA